MLRKGSSSGITVGTLPFAQVVIRFRATKRATTTATKTATCRLYWCMFRLGKLEGCLSVIDAGKICHLNRRQEELASLAFVL